MSTTYLCLVINREDGSLDAWNGIKDGGESFSLGDRVDMVIGDLEGSDEADPYVFPSEVVYMSKTENGDDYAILFTHEFDTTPEMEQRLADSGWDPADEQLLKDIDIIIDSTTVVASTHAVLLAVGDSQEEQSLRFWKRALEPEIPELPFFGERFYAQLFFSNVPEGEFARSERIGPQPKPGELLYVDEVVDLNDVGNTERGFPVLVFQSGKIDYGLAQISMYVKTLEPYDEFSLVADGWEPVSKEELDPEAERIVQRIDLASRTRIRLRQPEETDDGTMEIADYEIESPETVTEEQYSLLPDYLISHVEMQKEIEGLSEELNNWDSENRDEDDKRDNRG